MNSADQFETIVDDYYEPLFRFAMSLTHAESDAWDLTQHTFYVWATKGYQLRDRTKIKTWLFTTLHRTFLVGRRRQSRFFHHALEDVCEQLPAVSPDFADHVDSSQVLAALARVDEIYRASVALFYLEDYSYKEIAAIIEAPIGTVKSRIARGIAQLRAILSDGSPAPSLQKDRISSIPAKPAPDPEPLPPPRGQARLRAGASESGYAEWDLSSTLLGDPLGAA